MASLDKYSPYSTGMTAKQAVEALWNAYNSPKNNCKIIRSASAPTLADINNDCSFWYNERNCKLYRAWRNTDLNILLWFEV